MRREARETIGGLRWMKLVIYAGSAQRAYSGGGMPGPEERAREDPRAVPAIEQPVLRAPTWLSDAEAAALAEHFGAVVERGEDLSRGAYVLARGPVAAEAVVQSDVRGIELVVLKVATPHPCDHAEHDAWAETVAEYVATCEEDALLLCDRADWAADTAAIFAGYVDSIANLPTGRRIHTLIRWIELRCAEWRGKLAALAADAVRQRDLVAFVGQSPAEPRFAGPEVIAAVRAVPHVRRADEVLTRAERFVASAQQAFAASHAVLAAKLAEYRDEQSDRLQRSSRLVGLAVIATGFGAVVQMLANRGQAPFALSYGALAMTVLAAIPLFLYLRAGPLHEREVIKRRPPSWVVNNEARINALAEGYLDPLCCLLDDPERKFGEHAAESAPAIETAEREARSLFLRTFEELEEQSRAWQRTRVVMPAPGASVGVAREGAVSRLEQFAYTGELVTLFILDLGPVLHAAPDIAAVMWLKGRALGLPTSPFRWSFIETCVDAVLVEALDRSPVAVATVMNQLADTVRRLVQIDGSVDIATAIEGDSDDKLKERIREVSVAQAVETFTFLRVSRLIVRDEDAQSESRGAPSADGVGATAA